MTRQSDRPMAVDCATRDDSTDLESLPVFGEASDPPRCAPRNGGADSSGASGRPGWKVTAALGLAAALVAFLAWQTNSSTQTGVVYYAATNTIVRLTRDQVSSVPRRTQQVTAVVTLSPSRFALVQRHQAYVVDSEGSIRARLGPADRVLPDATNLWTVDGRGNGSAVSMRAPSGVVRARHWLAARPGAVISLDSHGALTYDAARGTLDRRRWGANAPSVSVLDVGAAAWVETTKDSSRLAYATGATCSIVSLRSRGDRVSVAIEWVARVPGRIAGFALAPSGNAIAVLVNSAPEGSPARQMRLYIARDGRLHPTNAVVDAPGGGVIWSDGRTVFVVGADTVAAVDALNGRRLFEHAVPRAS